MSFGDKLKELKAALIKFVERARDKDKRVDWWIVFVFGGIVSSLAIVIGWLAVNNYQVANHVDFHLGWLWLTLIITLLFVFIAGGIGKYALLGLWTSGRDQLHIDWVYPEGHEELVGPNLDHRGFPEEQAAKLDADEYEQEKWYPVKREGGIVEVDITEEQIKTAIVEIVADRTRPDPGHLSKMEECVQSFEALEAKRKKRLTSGKGLTFAIIKLEKRVYWAVYSGDKPVIHDSKTIIVEMPAGAKTAIRFRWMRVPSGGFNFDHSHAERIKLIYRGIMFGKVPVYRLSDSGYFDEVTKTPERDDSADEATGLLETVAFWYMRFQEKIQGDLQDLDAQRAAAEERQDSAKIQDLMNLANTDIDDMEVERAREESRRWKPRKEEVPFLWTAVIITAVSGWVMFFLVVMDIIKV